MKAYIFIIISLFCESAVFSQEYYLNKQFIQDKKVLENAAYKRLKENGIYKKEDSLQIIFIYHFQEFDLDTVEINNNSYLYKITPCYKYSNYLLFPIFRNKIPLQKRLCANGYVINKSNELVATITSNSGYPFYITPFSYSNSFNNRNLIQRDNEHKNLTINVLSHNYDLCFYLGLTGCNTIWCVKGNKTFIYDIEQHNFLTLSEYYNCCWKYHRIEDILGLPK